MRKLCPNFEKVDGLETVLEVPIPEDMWTSIGSTGSNRWHNLRALMRAQINSDKTSSSLSLSSSLSPSSSLHLAASSNNEFIALLKLVGCPLIPHQVQSDHTLTRPLKDTSIEASSAKYIVQQYIAAIGGMGAMDSLKSMYAVGQVRMFGSEMRQGGENIKPIGKAEVGGFVLWQKNPDLWHFELIVSGFKVSAGSDGKVAWNQSSSQPSQANQGPPRPLRRFFQLETAHDILQAQNTPHTEIVRHTVRGYFSQRTGLLVKFEDTKLVRMKPAKGNDSVFWETSMESVIEDYRCVDGINIGHGGKTVAILYRYGMAQNQHRKIEETWRIEEVDFNICGLSMDCFLPPSDLKKEQHGVV